MSRNLSPEAWKARVLADEIHDLTIIVRSLEFALGFAEGVQAGRWQGAHQTTDSSVGLGETAGPGEPGAAAGSAN